MENLWEVRGKSKGSGSNVTIRVRAACLSAANKIALDRKVIVHTIRLVERESESLFDSRNKALMANHLLNETIRL